MNLPNFLKKLLKSKVYGAWFNLKRYRFKTSFFLVLFFFPENIHFNTPPRPPIIELIYPFWKVQRGILGVSLPVFHQEQSRQNLGWGGKSEWPYG